ncbi:hypothetical protein R1flu_011761 [Riccia fluitans]|uniref:Reverse transcriptase domain-containing protein n=1 Tax=Riccia fluitans TaxID=41844 RepID=A0ABD1Z8P1_9MARC
MDNVDTLIEVWDILGSDYVAAMQQCWSEGIFPKGFLEGIITLIPKGDDTDVLTAWRPITLLSSLYKIYAKLISVRLEVILPMLISPQQQGFINGRNVHNNILLFSLVHEALKRERIELVSTRGIHQALREKVALKVLPKQNVRWEVDFSPHKCTVLS